MKRIMLAGMVLALAGCGGGDPSDTEIAQGMVRTFSRQAGVPVSNLRARARKIGDGRWAVTMEGKRYDGQRRTLNAIAVMDKNGGIHYYTD